MIWPCCRGSSISSREPKGPKRRMNGHGRDRDERREGRTCTHVSRQAHAFLRWPSPVYSAHSFSSYFSLFSSVAFIPFRSFLFFSRSRATRTEEPWAMECGRAHKTLIPLSCSREQKQKSNAQEEAQTQERNGWKAFFGTNRKPPPKGWRALPSVSIFSL